MIGNCHFPRFREYSCPCQRVIVAYMQTDGTGCSGFFVRRTKGGSLSIVRCQKAHRPNKRIFNPEPARHCEMFVTGNMSDSRPQKRDLPLESPLLLPFL